MIYKKFQDINLSRLGMGNMRLPVSRGRIDEKRAQEIIDYAMAQGVIQASQSLFWGRR